MICLNRYIACEYDSRLVGLNERLTKVVTLGIEINNPGEPLRSSPLRDRVRRTIDRHGF